ncbi:MAG: Rpn family recombination-promoting nuclease/putative transposase [Methanobacteriaceae archaeon]|jgi:hypothetical protein|nr:Rpn family recombination-promoting nuclease/putative transposase [Methanobacteriaceae archaeon]
MGNKNIYPSRADDKEYILDLRALTDSQDKIILKIQEINTKEFTKRSTHYLCTEFSKSVPKRRKQGKIKYKKHTLISIISFKLNKNKNFKQKFNLMGNIKCKYNYSDITIDFFSFKKNKKIDLNDPLNK